MNSKEMPHCSAPAGMAFQPDFCKLCRIHQYLIRSNDLSKMGASLCLASIHLLQERIMSLAQFS